MTPEDQKDALNYMARDCHERSVNAGWYNNPTTGEFTFNVGEKLALIHSEISEALEGVRKGIDDTHLPHRPMVEVELADALIRIFDLAAALKLDIGGAYYEKLAYNQHRADHKVESRAKANGKRF